jgi:hypothetical protein
MLDVDWMLDVDPTAICHHDERLKIAWQYSKSIQDELAGMKS